MLVGNRGDATVSARSHRRRRSEEATAQKSSFQLHDVCDGLKKKHTALEVFRRRNPIHCIYTRMSMACRLLSKSSGRWMGKKATEPTETVIGLHGR